MTRTQLCCTQPLHAALQRRFTLPPRDEGASCANPAPQPPTCVRLNCSISASISQPTALPPAAALTPAPRVAQPPAGRRRRLLLHYHQRRLLPVAARPWAGRAHRRKRICNLWAGAAAAEGRGQRGQLARRLEGGGSRGHRVMPCAACSPAPHARLTRLQGSQLKLPAQQQTRCLAGTQEISTWLCSSSRAILKACSVQRRRRVGSKGESGRPGHQAANAAPSARRLSGHAIAYAHALGRWCNFAHADYVVHGIFQRRVPSNRGSLIG